MKEIYIDNKEVTVELVNDQHSRIELMINKIYCRMLIYEFPTNALNAYTRMQVAQIKFHTKITTQFTTGKTCRMMTICMN